MAQRRNRDGNWRAALRGALWTGVTATAVIGAFWSVVSPTGLQRIANLSAPRGGAVVSGQDDAASAHMVAALQEQVGSLSRDVKSLSEIAMSQAKGQTAIQLRIAAVEDNLGSLTGSIPGKDQDRAGSVTVLPPDSGNSKSTSPLPADPVVTGSLPSGDQGQADGVNAPRVLKTRFAVELMTGQDIGKLERLWIWARDAAGDELKGLTPRLKLRPIAGGGNELALIAGPIDNAQDAARLCLLVKAVAPRCRTVAFGGRTLALHEQ